MDVLTKEDLVAQVADTLGSRGQAKAAVDAVFGAVADALAARHVVRLAGVGTLTPVLREGRQGTAPNGQTYATGARMGVRFRLASELDGRLNP